MRGLVDLVEVSCFIGWDEGFCGTVYFFDVMSELVLKFVVLVSKFNVYIYIYKQILVDAAAGYGLPPSQSFLFLLWASRRLFCHNNTPFAVHYEEIRNHLRKTATNSAKIHSLARKSEHLRINQIQ